MLYFNFQSLSILSSSLTLYVLIARKYSFIHNVDRFPSFLTRLLRKLTSSESPVEEVRAHILKRVYTGERVTRKTPLQTRQQFL